MGGGIDWEFEIDMYTLLYLKKEMPDISLGREYTLKEVMATHSSILAWKIP